MKRHVHSSIMAVALMTLALAGIAPQAFAQQPSAAAAAATPSTTTCAKPIDARIKRSCIVQDGQLWRGGRPDKEAAEALVEKGVKTVVNLELILDDLRTFKAVQLKPGTQATIAYFRLRDWEPMVVLSHKSVDERVVQFLAITRSQSGPIFVHCRSGQNRTGVMVAAYRLFQGAPMDEVLRDMKAYGGIWSTPIIKYLQTLTPEKRAKMEPQITAATLKLKATSYVVCRDGGCNTME